jgi:hypothetical protein
MVARDAWYQGQLESLLGDGVRSTRQVHDDDQFRLLMNTFLVLSEGGERIEIYGWSEKQNRQFRILCEKAWRVSTRRGQTEGLAFGLWLDSLLEESGISQRQAPDCVESYDKAMAATAVIAGDEYWIGRTASAAETRMRYLIRGLMHTMSDLTGETVDWSYVRAIYTRMDLPLDMDQASAAWLWKVLQAMDTHVRRLEQRRGDAQKAG